MRRSLGTILAEQHGIDDVDTNSVSLIGDFIIFFQSLCLARNGLFGMHDPGRLKPVFSSSVSERCDDVGNAIERINGIRILHCSDEKQFCLPLTCYGPAEVA